MSIRVVHIKPSMERHFDEAVRTIKKRYLTDESEETLMELGYRLRSIEMSFHVATIEAFGGRDSLTGQNGLIAWLNDGLDEVFVIDTEQTPSILDRIEASLLAQAPDGHLDTVIKEFKDLMDWIPKNFNEFGSIAACVHTAYMASLKPDITWVEKPEAVVMGSVKHYLSDPFVCVKAFDRSAKTIEHLAQVNHQEAEWFRYLKILIDLLNSDSSLRQRFEDNLDAIHEAAKAPDAKAWSMKAEALLATRLARRKPENPQALIRLWIDNPKVINVAPSDLRNPFVVEPDPVINW